MSDVTDYIKLDFEKAQTIVSVLKEHPWEEVNPLIVAIITAERCVASQDGVEFAKPSS